MKYCYNCNRSTIGEALFCNFCGRSYNIKLCPKLHVNPRNAEACSQCGSHDLSIPQPRVPFWATLSLVLLTMVTGLLLVMFSLAVAVFSVEHTHSPDSVLAPAIPLGILWWGWTRIPPLFRERIYRMLQRKRGIARDD
jgi:hypothetical protein